MSPLKVNSIIPVAGVPTGGGGGIIQIKQAVKTDTFSESVNSESQSSFVTGLQPTITPTSSSSKIFVYYSLSLCSSGGGQAVQLFRDSTQIALGDAAGNRQRVTSMGSEINVAQPASVNFGFLDSPATTSSITYKVRFVFCSSSGQTVQVNFGTNDTDNAQRVRCASAITLFEVSA